jgi:hypothetical protein
MPEGGVDVECFEEGDLLGLGVGEGGLTVDCACGDTSEAGASSGGSLTLGCAGVCSSVFERTAVSRDIGSLGKGVITSEDDEVTSGGVVLLGIGGGGDAAVTPSSPFSSLVSPCSFLAMAIFLLWMDGSFFNSNEISVMDRCLMMEANLLLFPSIHSAASSCGMGNSGLSSVIVQGSISCVGFSDGSLVVGLT